MAGGPTTRSFRNYHCNSKNNDNIKYSVDTTRSATTHTTTHTTTHMLNAYREQMMKLYTNIVTKIEDCLSNTSTRTSNFAINVDDDGMICNDDDDDGICTAREPSPTSVITKINQ